MKESRFKLSKIESKAEVQEEVDAILKDQSSKVSVKGKNQVSAFFDKEENK
jgi:hypothetical protein